MDKTKTDIWMPWYILDYRKDTGELLLVEDAVYRRALEFLWLQKGRMSASPERIQSALRISRSEYKQTAWIFERYFYHDGDQLGNDRIDIELEKAKIKAEKAKINGRTGGRPAGSSKPKANPEHNPEITQPVISGFENPLENSQKNNPEKSSPQSQSDLSLRERFSRAHVNGGNHEHSGLQKQGGGGLGPLANANANRIAELLASAELAECDTTGGDGPQNED
jgi:uncharacterized protein YdaU (DUF1376 family)